MSLKVGDLFNGLEILDVQVATGLNLLQFLKRLNPLLEEGYVLDLNSVREIGLQKKVFLYKLEDVKGEEAPVSTVTPKQPTTRKTTTKKEQV